MNVRPTPETDACSKSIDQSNFEDYWRDDFEEFAWVPADFARKLESERDGVLYARWMGDTGSTGSQGHAGNVGDGGESGRQHPEQARPAWAASWADSDTILCADGKARRFEPGIFPLAHGLPRGVVPSGDPGSAEYANATGEARVMRLKGYGNAICAPLAAMFISTCMEVIPHE